MIELSYLACVFLLVQPFSFVPSLRSSINIKVTVFKKITVSGGICILQTHLIDLGFSPTVDTEYFRGYTGISLSAHPLCPSVYKVLVFVKALAGVLNSGFNFCIVEHFFRMFCLYLILPSWLMYKVCNRWLICDNSW